MGRWAALVAGLWAGMLAAIGAIAAPAAFAVLPVPEAGRLVGRLFAQEAYASLVAGLLVFVLERQRTRSAVEAGTGRALSPELLLVLGAFFCVVLGYFALLPMMESARAGQGPLSFAALHATSASLFVLRGVLVLVLAWRLIGRGAPRRPG